MRAPTLNIPLPAPQKNKVAHLVTDDADDPIRLVLLMMLGSLLTAWRGVPVLGPLLAPIVSFCWVVPGRVCCCFLRLTLFSQAHHNTAHTKKQRRTSCRSAT